MNGTDDILTPGWGSLLAEESPVPEEPGLALMHAGCTHPDIIMDTEDLAVYCRKCERPVDPFVILLGYAHRERSFFHNRDQAKQHIKILRGQLEELQRKKRNLQAQVRRLEGKAGE